MHSPAVPHDFETASECDLRSAGVDVYAEHPSTRILCLAYKLKGKLRVWFPGEPDPADLLEHIAAGGPLTAYNAPFEMAMWHYVIRRDYPHWPQPRLEQFSCTMARALALALPGSLDKCGEALALDIRKDKAGHRLMMTMCRPTPAWRKWQAGGCQGPEPQKWNHTSEKLKALGAYCAQDVVSEEAIGAKIAQLTPDERATWLLDQRINRRGVRLDIENVRAAYQIAQAETRALNKRLEKITDIRGLKVTNTNKLLGFVRERGLMLEDLKKRTVAVALAQGVEDKVAKEVLQIRKDAGKASVAKLKAMLACVSEDGRARGLLGYHVATTGRWAGRRIQPQNFPRPDLEQDDIEAVIALMSQPAAADCIRFGYAEPISAIASSLRGMIVPSPGRHFVGGDLANIEGRGLAWLAGEEWKLQAFRDYDAGTGLDLYILAYARSFGVDPHTIGKKDPRRQVGKTEELALGYMGGPLALLAMALSLGVDITEIAKIAHGVTSRDDWEYATSRMPADEDKRGGLAPFVWTGLRVVVDAWRDAHPEIRGFWYDLEECAINATLNKGKIFSTKTRRVKYIATNSFLFSQLPSGRCLAYAKPSVSEVPKTNGKGTKLQLEYYGQGKKSKKWEKRKAYGGLLAEQATQGTARDVLVACMHRAERKGYPIVLHVHDEILAEMPAGRGSKAEMEAILSTAEPWAAGLPLAAEAWTGTRYQK